MQSWLEPSMKLTRAEPVWPLKSAGVQETVAAAPAREAAGLGAGALGAADCGGRGGSWAGARRWVWVAESVFGPRVLPVGGMPWLAAAWVTC